MDSGVRDLGFVAWKDPDAWMEKMEGPRWNAVIKEENQRFEKLIRAPEIQQKIKEFRGLLPSESEHFLFHSDSVEILYRNQFFLEWRWGNTTSTYKARDVVSIKKQAWSTTDIGEGAEQFELQMYAKNKKTPEWTMSPVGPNVAILGDRCLYLGVLNKLWYNTLWACDKDTGKNPVLLYNELDPRCNLSIFRGEDAIFLIRENSQIKNYFKIASTGELTEVPNIYDPPPSSILPSGEYGIDMYWKKHKMLLTRQHGKKILWKLDPIRKIVDLPAGQILIDPWRNTFPLTMRIETPSQSPDWYYLDGDGNTRLIVPTHSSGLKLKRGTAKSKDGTQVSYVVTYKTQPQHLLVIGYGAYGLPSTSAYVGTRWNPLIQNGWGIVYTFIRGGGDHTEDWAKAGRREGRAKTIEDFLACVRQVKEEYQLTPRNIVIYGRSAGGLLMGGSMALEPEGELFSGVFAEVPYVDELRTTTNMNLPLTQLEYNEFGDPAHRLSDFLSVGLLSPADSAIELKTPNIFVYSKTAVHDSEVFTYEPVKWIRRLRNHKGVSSAPKVLAIDMSSGHFTLPEKSQENFAIDCAVLDGWVKEKI